MNTNLSEGFLFASGALGALSLLLVIALVRSGVEGMAKIWPLLGPMLGGLLGTVTTSYFADDKVASVKAETAGQIAMVARNVSVALEELQEENAQLRAARATGVAVGGGYGTLLPAAHSAPWFGGESADIATPPTAATPAR